MDESAVGERPEAPSKAHVVKAEWFWTSVQKEISLEEKQYLFDDVCIKTKYHHTLLYIYIYIISLKLAQKRYNGALYYIKFNMNFGALSGNN